jgi:hypothetical protein
VEVIEPSFGFLTFARDLVERHTLDLRLLFSTSDARASGRLGYAFRGLGNPILTASVSQWWDASGPSKAVVQGDTVDFFALERERSANLSATFRRLRFRRALAFTLGSGMVWERRSVLDLDLSESELSFRRPDLRLAELWGTAEYSDVRRHAFSFGPEDGVAAFVTGRARREMDLPTDERGVGGSDRSFREVFGRIRAYRGIPGPGFADHVVALRATGGLARGPGADFSHYDVGGSAGDREPITGFSLFGGTSWFYTVRGFTNGVRSGRNAWSASLEYRVPLALVNRGAGLFPLHVDRVSASLFADAGNAWGTSVHGALNPRRSTLASVGGEVVTDLLTFFTIPLTLRTGVAVRTSGGEGTTLYVRIGRNF